MSNNDEAADHVAAVLSQFPGPVMISAPKYKRVGTCVVLTLLIGVLAWSAWHSAGSWNQQQVVFNGFAAFICIAVEVLAILALFSNLNFVRLDADGFDVQFPWKRRRRSWKEVDEFKVGRSGKGLVVAFNDETGNNSFLSYTYGFTKRDFVRLMAEWRERALSLPR